jgi:hypothetical protein
MFMRTGMYDPMLDRMVIKMTMMIITELFSKAHSTHRISIA